MRAVRNREAIQRIIIMRYPAIAVALVLTVTATATALAGDIYKWTDEDGNVHYGDQPTGERPERLDIQSKPTDPARITAMARARSELKARAAEKANEARALEPTPEEIQAAIDERAQNCADSVAQLQKYTESRRLYRTDESGERDYLDEEEMQATRKRTEDEVQEYCSP